MMNLTQTGETYGITNILIEQVAAIQQAGRALVANHDANTVKRWREVAERNPSGLPWIPGFVTLAATPTNFNQPTHGWNQVRLLMTLTIVRKFANQSTVMWKVTGWCDTNEHYVKGDQILIPDDMQVHLDHTSSYTPLSNNSMAISNTDVLLTSQQETALNPGYDIQMAVTPTTVTDNLQTLTFGEAEGIQMDNIQNLGAAITSSHPIRANSKVGDPSTFCATLHESFTTAIEGTANTTINANPWGIASIQAGSASVLENPVISWLLNNEYSGTIVRWGDLKALCQNVMGAQWQDIIVFNKATPILDTAVMPGDWNSTDMTTLVAAQIDNIMQQALIQSGLYYVDVTITLDGTLNPVIIPNNNNAFKGYVNNLDAAIKLFSQYVKQKWWGLIRPFGPDSAIIVETKVSYTPSNAEIIVSVDGGHPTWYQVASWSMGLTHSTIGNQDTLEDISAMTMNVLS